MSHNAYSIIGEQGSVLASFYADCDADAYVDAYLRAEQLGHGAEEGPHCKLVSYGSTIVLSCPFSEEEKTALRLAAKFCATMSTLASFRLMRTLATTMRVSGQTGIRCAHILRLVGEGYAVRHEFGIRRLANGRDFFFERDLTKIALDFAEWIPTREPS